MTMLIQFLKILILFLYIHLFICINVIIYGFSVRGFINGIVDQRAKRSVALFAWAIRGWKAGERLDACISHVLRDSQNPAYAQLYIGGDPLGAKRVRNI